MTNKQNSHKLQYLPVSVEEGKFLVGSSNGTVVFSTVSVDWNDVAGKPTTFTPEAHTHDWSEIQNRPDNLEPTAHSHAWSEITDKPADFPPSAHNHDALYEPKLTTKGSAFNKDFGTGSDNVSRGNHTHSYSEITGTPPAVNSYTKAESDAKYALKTAPPSNFGFVYAPTDLDVDNSSENNYSNIGAAYAGAGASIQIVDNILQVTSGTEGIQLANTSPTSISQSNVPIDIVIELSLPELTESNPGTKYKQLFIGIVDASGEESTPLALQQQQSTGNFGIMIGQTTGANTWELHCFKNVPYYSSIRWFDNYYDLARRNSDYSPSNFKLNHNTWYRLEIKIYQVNYDYRTTLKVINAEDGAGLLDVTRDFYTSEYISTNSGRNPRVVLSTLTEDSNFYIKATDFKIRRWIEVRG